MPGDRVFSFAAAVGVLSLTVPARAELSAVWALDDGEKIKADALDQPLARGNATFRADPPQVTLFGLRNETVAFQVILAGGDADTADVSVSLDSIGPISNADAVGDDPDHYWLGRRIEIFEERYLDVVIRSHDMAWQPWSDAQPGGMTGPVPDPLVPARRPFTVPARRNQGVWVDVYIPKDAPEGVHHGELVVRVGGEPCALSACRLPIELTVHEQALPDVPSTRTMVWFSGGEHNREVMAARYFEHPWDAPGEAVAALRRRHFWLARRHRITLIIGEEEAPAPEMRSLLDGSAYGRAAGYDGPGESLPDDVYSILTYGGELSTDQARKWDAFFRESAPAVEHFLYVTDEPHDPAAFPALNDIAARARPIPAFVTHPYTDALDFDIFCALPDAYSPAQADALAAQAGGAHAKLWLYNGVRPFSGTFVTDDVAVSPRVNPWIQHQFGVGRWFYWEATYYRDTQGGRGNIDVFAQANNFRVGDEDKLNGDGLLMYPGRDRLFPAHDFGIDAPLPSIRLKNWRRGIQDVEYLVLLEKAGHADFARRVARTLVPQALADETQAGDPVSWPENGEPWLAARRLLFDALVNGEPPAADIARLARPSESWLSRAHRTLRRWLDPLLRSPRRRFASAGAAMMFVAAALWLWLWRRRHSQPRKAVQR